MRRSCLFAVFLAALAIPGAVADLSFAGRGSSLASVAINQWTFSYSVLRPDVSITYSPTGSGSGVSGSISNLVDFGVSDSALTDSQFQQSVPPDDVVQVPILASPVVLPYNLPYGDLMNSTDQTKRLILDRPTAAAIFAQQITNWRDPQILALQTAYVAALLPNAPIKLVVRGDSSGTTNVAQSAFRSFANGSWPWGTPSNSWSGVYLAASNVYRETQNFGVAGGVLAFEDSIGYVAFSTIAQESTLFRYARMINRNGDLLSTPDVSSAVAQANLNSRNAFALIDSALPGAWPIAAPSYLLIRRVNSTLATCDARRQLLLFWQWCLTSTLAQTSLSFYGYAPVGTAIAAASMSSLATVPCDESRSSAVAFIAVSQHSDGFEGLLAVNWLFFVAELSIAVFYLLKKAKNQPVTLLFFLAMIILGALCCHLGLSFFYLRPTNDSICLARVWLFGLGFTLLLGALFFRGYQVYMIFRITNSSSGGGLQTLKTSSKGFYALPIMAVVVGAQLVLLIVWSAVDPMRSTRGAIDPLRSTFEYKCSSDSISLWLGLEVAFFFLLLGFGLFVVYKTWDVKHMIRESKWISISIYNTVVVLAILIALLSAMPHPSDDEIFWLASSCALFLTLTTVIAIFLPKIIVSRLRADTNLHGSSTDEWTTDATGNRSRRVDGPTISGVGASSPPAKSNTRYLSPPQHQSAPQVNGPMPALDLPANTSSEAVEK